jgi:hypothetical protein
MRSVCVVCTRARALITDRDRRHQHAVLCTLLLLRRLRTQHPSTPLAARRCLRSRLLHHRRCCLRSRLLLGPWPLLLLALGLAASQSPPSLLALAAPPSPPFALARFSLFSRVCGFFGAPRSCCCDLIAAVAGASSPSSPFFLSYLISPSWASLSALIYIIHTLFCFITFEL